MFIVKQLQENNNIHKAIYQRLTVAAPRMIQYPVKYADCKQELKTSSSELLKPQPTDCDQEIHVSEVQYTHAAEQKNDRGCLKTQ